ncbi:hypothetical protein EGK75_13345 [Neisseria weixii]|uniref:DUF551 domain-containing protein n=1 Tax=Neisseria weixii TaxID=1853276 RepID=A0A3N4MTU4_9NEIS|nr:hypothetical protein [Neisseria weixii]RPD83090.1 hypothetical protein EGK74_13535 [Neisseria weixii]RPD83336.1 hypothetical protein EGK75_13345 [Neisseria weixii]
MTEEQIEKERVDFEAWYKSTFDSNFLDRTTFDYDDLETRTMFIGWLAGKVYAEKSMWYDRDDTRDYFDEPEVIVQTEFGDVFSSEAYLDNGVICFACEEELDPWGKVLYWRHFPEPRD